jgi:ATP-dependent Clp protease ATP-binding subunit ClpA
VGAASAAVALIITQPLTHRLRSLLQVVARWTGIPVTRLQQTEREKLLRLREELHRCASSCPA